MSRLLAWLNERNLVGLRAVIVYATLYTMVQSFRWAAAFAAVSRYDALGTAAIIGAVTAPVSILLGAVASIYTNSKGYD